MYHHFRSYPTLFVKWLCGIPAWTVSLQFLSIEGKIYIVNIVIFSNLIYDPSLVWSPKFQVLYVIMNLAQLQVSVLLTPEFTEGNKPHKQM